MKFIKLTDICNPKQWKTISTADFVDDGKYDVYGANGVIGRTNLYNHDSPTLLLTCRGATCGALNITKGKCYVNGNAMCLDNLSADFNLYFIYYYLKFYDMKKVISGTAQPQITINSLNKVLIPLISKERQEIIVRELRQIENSINIGSDQLLNFDEVVKSQFIEMFGDPINNEKKWNQEQLANVCKVINGRAYKDSELLDSGKYRVLRVGNFFTNNSWYYSDLELPEDKYCEYGDLLFAWSASFGPRIWYGEKVIYHYHIWKLSNYEEKLNKVFFMEHLNYQVEELRNNTHGSTMQHFTKADMEKQMLVIPPIELQNKFADFVQQIDKSKFIVQKQIKLLEELLEKKMNEYFGQ